MTDAPDHSPPRDKAYEGIDAQTATALRMTAEEVVAQSPAPIEIHDDNDAMIASFAQLIGDDYRRLLGGDRERVLMIVPVGPVGQYDLLARACTETDRSLDRLTLILMDEYLTVEGNWIPETDPLSFRRHAREHLLDLLPANKRPRVVTPDPRDLDNVASVTEDLGGVDVCYAGVGVTGHLAFNDPVPGYDVAAWFASRGTRVVELSPETRLINSVTAARGNVSRIPRMAVTVGMKDILGARQLRVFMNRPWQCAAIRRLLFGPVTSRFPASLARRHKSLSLHVVRDVLDQPEPGLR